MRPVKWTEKAIKEAFDDFISEYGRLPSKKEMYGKHNGKFPRTLSVKSATGISLETYLKINYTEYHERKRERIYGVMTHEYWIEDFKKQYADCGCPGESKYNKLRNKNTPCTQTLAKMMGVSTWRELLHICGFCRGDENELVCELTFEESLENYRKISDKLKKINTGK